MDFAWLRLAARATSWRLRSSPAADGALPAFGRVRGRLGKILRVLGLRSAGLGALALSLLFVAACAGSYQRGEQLYSQGDIAGALAVWRGIPPSNGEYTRAHARLETLEQELTSSLARYEKRAQFFEDEGRLAEAVLY